MAFFVQFTRKFIVTISSMRVFKRLDNVRLMSRSNSPHWRGSTSKIFEGNTYRPGDKKELTVEFEAVLECDEEMSVTDCDEEPNIESWNEEMVYTEAYEEGIDYIRTCEEDVGDMEGVEEYLDDMQWKGQIYERIWDRDFLHEMAL